MTESTQNTKINRNYIKLRKLMKVHKITKNHKNRMQLVLSILPTG